jgi:protein-S-isoprenylcysteine O-methyltransferase Ste14
MRYILLVIFWITWCSIHSALIGFDFTEALRKRFPNRFRFYRILYNLLAVATLLPVVFYTFSQGGAPIVAWEGPWRIVPILMVSVGLFFFVAGARRYDLLQFLGLRQIKDAKVCSVLTDDCSLDTGGILSIIRHPWYSAGILFIWARPLDLAAILTNLIVTGYFAVGAILEERKLKIQFGQQYADYQRQVSMFFPIKWAGRVFFKRN